MDDSNMNRKETEVRDVPCSIWKCLRRQKIVAEDWEGLELSWTSGQQESSFYWRSGISVSVQLWTLISGRQTRDPI